MISQKLHQFLSQILRRRHTINHAPALAAEGTPIIRLRDLHKDFSEAGSVRTVLDGINLSIKNGEYIALLGNSGSGKSTLLNLISGIEKPTSGSISIQDVSITALRERERTLFRRDHIGFVFQFFNLIPTLTVLENVTLPQELAGYDNHTSQKIAVELLQQVGLADRCDTFPDKLSGGEQQRVALARALIHNPMLVLADEPTGNLDEETGGRVLNLLLDLTRRKGKTLIMATHNPEIAHLADRTFRLYDGAIVEEKFADTVAHA